MKAMSIIGIVLLSWLLMNRIHQYELLANSLGVAYTPTESSIASGKFRISEQIFVTLYGIAYAITGTVYFSKRRPYQMGSNAHEIATLFELKEKGALSTEEYEREKTKIIG